MPKNATWKFPALICLFAVPLLTGTAFGQQPEVPDELRTIAEKGNYQATSLSADVENFLSVCDERSEYVRRIEYGKTVDGRPMSAVIVAKGEFQIGKPMDLADRRLRVLIIGNIHSGECDGKEALLEILRNFVLDPNPVWLDKMVLVIAPNYNADGNDKIAKTNRPGQIGPTEGMGVRANSQQFDLNRDFVKLESMEAQNLIKLMDQLDPHVFIDCHTTNGSRHRYLLTYDVPHNPSVSEEIRGVLRKQLMPEITRRLAEQKIDTFYYGNFDRSGKRWETYGFEPRYSIEYAGLRGILGFLSESYSYATYEERIRASREFVLACLNICLEQSDQLQSLLRSDREELIGKAAARPDSVQVVIDAAMAPFDKKETIFTYQKEEPAEVEVEFWGRYEPVVTASLPYAYVFSGEKSAWADKLQQHGIQVEKVVSKTLADVEIETIQSIHRASREFQKHKMVRLETTSQTVKREIPADWYLVRTSQPLGKLAAYMLEARTCEGLVTWNFLDDSLQEKGEYPIWRVTSPIAPQTAK